MKESFLKKNGIRDYSIKPIPSDASFRKYNRIINKKGGQHILVISPKSKVDNVGFIKVSKIFKKINLSVPEIISYDERKNMFLLEDFGDNTFNKYIKIGYNEEKLYDLALKVLLHIKKKSPVYLNKLPQYSSDLFIKEFKLFLKWYWPLIYKKKPNKKIVSSIMKIWKELLSKNLKTTKVITHRDFHIDNLFFLKKRNGLKACGIIDFQDAVIGPSSYDLLSLLEDARRKVKGSVVKKIYNKYLSSLNKYDATNFNKEYITLAANRHIKVIGIFSRLFVRDKKKIYIKHIPRVWKMLEQNLEDPTLYDLRLWFDEYFPKKKRIKPNI